MGRLYYVRPEDGIVYAGGGDDEIYGSAGDDSVRGEAGHDWLYGGGGYDFLVGGDGHDHLYGEDGPDYLLGDSGDDMLSGARGDDVLRGGSGFDALFGGLGDDLFVLDDANDSVVEFAGQGYDTVRAWVSYTLPGNVESLILAGSAADGTGNSLGNDIVGNTGSNRLCGGGGDDDLHGDAGDDSLHGDEGLDHLYGDAGSDFLDGGAGSDIMYGGAGDDYYIVDSTSDQVSETAGEGRDTVSSHVTSYTLPDNVEDLSLFGSARNGTGNGLDNTIHGNDVGNTLMGGNGNDWLSGRGGDDYLVGGIGSDTMRGGSGDDTYDVDSSGDSVTENAGEGHDAVISSVTYTLGANVEDLYLIGVRAIDGTGNALDNRIYGNPGNNVLPGRRPRRSRWRGRQRHDVRRNRLGRVSCEPGRRCGRSSIRAKATTRSSPPSTTRSPQMWRTCAFSISGGAIDGTGNDLDNDITGNGSGNLLYRPRRQ